MIPYYHCINQKAILLICAILLILFYTRPQISSGPRSTAKNRRTISHDTQIDELTLRIEDLKRIKTSIRNELSSIASEKRKILKEKSSLTIKNEKLNNQILKSKAQLRQLELDISANRKQKFDRTCEADRIAPIIFNPLKSQDLDRVPSIETDDCIFDLSRCPLTRGFKFYLTDDVSRSERSAACDVLKNHRQYTSNKGDACIVITLIESPVSQQLSNLSNEHNHAILDLMGNGVDIDLQGNKKVVIASSNFKKGTFRNDLDIILPSVWKQPEYYNEVINAIPPQSPLERKYLASYIGNNAVDSSELKEILQVVHRNSIDDSFWFSYNNGQDEPTDEVGKVIESSVFHIILPNQYHQEQQRYEYDLLYHSLAKGTIPVILGRNKVRLPFDEVIDWRKAAIIIPVPRLPEIHFILRSIDISDLYELKYHGRRIFENHLATTKQILDTLITVISLERFNYPPPTVLDYKTQVHSRDYTLNLDTNCTQTSCIETRESLTQLVPSNNDMLGPREAPFPSRRFRRNLTLALTSNYEIWNSPMRSISLQVYPSHPNDPLPPSEFKYMSPEHGGFRPINDGLGGSGAEFSRSLGGDYYNEQFTIVILTYQRRALLMKTLERLKGLAYLNKILVVWNDDKRPPARDLVWPDVGVPIVLVQVERNSLNNRFLPYDEIETDAILSLDDDTPLRPDEIVFAFRVWRQSRERIVGFPGRYHAWDNDIGAWTYSSNHSCELSMVLTGGAFFHKYYTYLYSFEMPEVIRKLVDKFMNCEDIAMNFLVAHLTRQPPIKVTSRWTFHCAGCTTSLSEDDSHFRERHECLNTFASIYGYMPLRSTQHRSDSILFKTRLPQNKQKCFKFV